MSLYPHLSDSLGQPLEVADPDHESWQAVPQATARCGAPWHAGARDQQLQMAKDVVLSGVRGFFLGAGAMHRAEARKELVKKALCRRRWRACERWGIRESLRKLEL